MTDKSNNKISLQLVTEHSGLIEAFGKFGDIEVQQINSLGVPDDWRKPSVSCGITLLDMRSSKNSTEDAIRYIGQIKQLDPAHFIIVVGEMEQLVDLLDSSVHALLYRVFSGAIPPRLMLTAIRSAGALTKSHPTVAVSADIPDQQVSADVESSAAPDRAAPIRKKTDTVASTQNGKPGAGSQTEPQDPEPSPADAVPAPDDDIYKFIADEALDAEVLNDSRSPVKTATPDERVEKHGPPVDRTAGQRDGTDTVHTDERVLIETVFPVDADEGGEPDDISEFDKLADLAISRVDDTEPDYIDDNPDNLPDTEYPYSPPNKFRWLSDRTPMWIFSAAGMALVATAAYLMLPGSPAENTTNLQTLAATSSESESSAVPTGTLVPEAIEIANELVVSIKSSSRKVIDFFTDLPAPDLSGQNNQTEKIAANRQASATTESVGIEQLLLWARADEAEGRLFEPRDDNALYYFEQALEINGANTLAKKGRARVLAAVEASVVNAVDKKLFVRASKTLEQFSVSHPKHSANRHLLAIVKAALERELKQVRDNPESNIDASIAMLKNMGSTFSKTHNSLLKRKIERDVLAKIDWAIDNGFLLPPDQRNVFDQLLQARVDRSVSTDNLNARALEVSGQLYERAQNFLEEQDLEEVGNLLMAMKLLDVDQAAIQRLEQALDHSGNGFATGGENELRQAELAQSSESVGQAGELITQARVLHMVEPLYPREAKDRLIEGWVKLKFVVDEIGQLRDLSVIDEEPPDVFTEAAISAIVQWQFQPARDRIARSNVAANFSVKLDFTLQR